MAGGLEGVRSLTVSDLNYRYCRSKTFPVEFTDHILSQLQSGTHIYQCMTKFMLSWRWGYSILDTFQEQKANIFMSLPPDLYPTMMSFHAFVSLKIQQSCHFFAYFVQPVHVSHFLLSVWQNLQQHVGSSTINASIQLLATAASFVGRWSSHY